ncbi:MAG: glycosyltransferase family 4 protein [Thermodesulfobacteriota bacterium]
MKIGLVIYGDLDLVSGGYLYDRMLVGHLKGRGARIDILSLPARSYGLLLADNLSGALPRAVKAHGFDLLLEDELNHPSLFYLNRRLRKVLKGPIIAIVHHLRSSEPRPAWQNAFYRRVERRYLEGVDGFVFNSDTTRLAVETVLGTTPPSVVALPGGDHLLPRLDDGALARRCHEAGPLRILFVGNVIPRKGLHTLLAALDRLRRESWLLTVAGSLSADRRYAARIRRRISRSGFDRRVTLLDTVPTGRISDLMETHQCLAVPSYYEGYGIAYLEAMGFGQPLIASRAGAAPEGIDDGREGFLVAPGDSEGLAEAIGRLLRDRTLLETMSRAARARYRGHPPWAAGMARVEDFLERMAGKRSG